MVCGTDLIAELELIFAGSFPGSRAELDIAPLSGKLGGFLVWSGFAGHTQEERGFLLGKRLGMLPFPHQSQIGAIFVVTNDELDSMLDGE